MKAFVTTQKTMEPTDINLSGNNGKCVSCGNPLGRQAKMFCSKTCRFAGNLIKAQCNHCGKSFNTRIHLVRSKRGKFCSIECGHLGKRNGKVVEFNGKVYTKSHGYFVSTIERTFLHRDIWVFHNGPIPSGYVIHHKDENKENNYISNLQLMERGEHTRHHMKKNDGVKIVKEKK